MRMIQSNNFVGMLTINYDNNHKNAVLKTVLSLKQWQSSDHS